MKTIFKVITNIAALVIFGLAVSIIIYGSYSEYQYINSPKIVCGDSAISISHNDTEIIFTVDTSEMHTRWYKTGDTLHIRKLIEK